MIRANTWQRNRSKGNNREREREREREPAKHLGTRAPLEEMNGEGGEGEVDAAMAEATEVKERTVLMWGHLSGASPQRQALLSPVPARLPGSLAGDSWMDVCGGGFGFAMAISGSGKIITWGSLVDQGQSYLASGKHVETPEAFPLPTKAAIVQAAAGWAHCVAVTVHGEVYTWGWKECIPSGNILGDQSTAEFVETEECKRRRLLLSDQVSKGSPLSEQELENSTPADETFSAPPCLVMLGAGVRIITVAAGGRHTLALSDAGQVWGWGYGGDGQLGLGYKVHTVSTPRPVNCDEFFASSTSKAQAVSGESVTLEGQAHEVAGTNVKTIACGDRHSAVVTDTGALLTFGWGCYGQCGQGNTDDVLRPTLVSSLLGIRIQDIAAGVGHTLCTSVDGNVYAFGGNLFGQLGTGTAEAEAVPKLIDTWDMENKNAKVVSCGAHHSTMVTEDGTVFCWGLNAYGQLGLGDAVNRKTPTQVPLGTRTAKNVSCGSWHTLVLAESHNSVSQ